MARQPGGSRPIERPPDRAGRLRDVAVLCRTRREQDGYSVRALGRAARVSERTIRRIEAAEAVDLDSHDRLGVFFGLPRRWFLYPDEMSDPAQLYRSRTAAVDRSLSWAIESSLLGPHALRFLQRFFAFADVQGGPAGRLEGLAFEFAKDLVLPAERPPSRPRR